VFVYVEVLKCFWKEHISERGLAIYIVIINEISDAFRTVKDDARVSECDQSRIHAS